MTETLPLKPLFRGRVHQLAFYKTIILTILFTVIFISVRKFSIELIIYLLSQLILYGVSSTYHITPFKSDRSRRIFQKLDHSSIFILIAGTQTSVFLLLQNTANKSSIITFVIITWSISLIGMMKIFVWNSIFKMIDVVIYIGHGICVIPFFPLLINCIEVQEIFLYIMGGLIYISGGIMFGREWPDLFPKIFGYHEVFHVMTVLANLCFMVPIIIKSLVKLSILKK